jgi:Histidine kinase-like ATPase domain
MPYSGWNGTEVPNPPTAENLQAEHGRGIFLMKFWMDEVFFEQRGTEVHMQNGSPVSQKGKARNSNESQSFFAARSLSVIVAGASMRMRPRR